MQKVLCSVIDDDQTGYSNGRFIGQNIRFVSDIIENNKYKNGILLFLDFKKAFDSVEWDFMFESVKLFNFSPMFCQWIKTMYTNPVFCLKNNGYLSSRITMERGIRQGCPVSALLFILVVEVLSINIRENKNIHGLEAAFMHKKKYIKLSQYADDCTVFLKNKANIKELLAEIKYFTDASGLELNINKTIGIDFTETDEQPDYDYLGINFTSKPVKCLGIYVRKNDRACQDLNWSKKIALNCTRHCGKREN